MKIASADLSLSSAHLSASRVEVSERLRAWVGARPTEDADRPTPRSVVVSNAARQALDLDKSAATDAAGKIDGEDADIDPRLALIKSIVEMMTGRRIEVMSTTDMATGEAASRPAPPPPDFGIEYDRTETRETLPAAHAGARARRFPLARTPAEHAHYREQISLGFPLERAPDESLVLDIQGALWNAGLARAAGPTDILIAAYALVNEATVLAADHDFGHIARVTDLRHEYVAPSS